MNKIEWFSIASKPAKILSTPTIYLNPKHKRIFFYPPYAFVDGDYIMVDISHDKRYLKFTWRNGMMTYPKGSYVFNEFNDKSKGTIDCKELFEQFPEIFTKTNKLKFYYPRSNYFSLNFSNLTGTK